MVYKLNTCKFDLIVSIKIHFILAKILLGLKL